MIWRASVSLLIAVLLAGCAHDPYSVVVIDANAKPGKAAAKNTSTYKIKKGDTLYSIAFANDVSMAELTRINGITEPYVIYPKQVLLIPSAVSSVSIVKPQKKVLAASKKNRVKLAVAKPSLPTPVKPPAKLASKLKSKPIIAKPTIVAGSGWLKPVAGDFGKMFTQGKAPHKGVDIHGRLGSKVVASRGGKVVYAGAGLKDYGLLVIIKHDQHYLSAYAYNQKIIIKEGDIVKQGQQISTRGKKQGKPLLHFEIRKNGKPINPLNKLPK